MFTLVVGGSSFDIRDQPEKDSVRDRHEKDSVGYSFDNDLHWAIEQDSTGHVTKKIIKHHPDILDSYRMVSQFHPAIVNALVSSGYVPNQEYLMRLTLVDDESHLEILRCLCKNMVLEKIIPDINDDTIGFFCNLDSVARVFMEFGYLSREAHSELCAIRM